MRILIMSDIHGNEQALQVAIKKAREEYNMDACILLGDIIDYGMHSNEVIRLLEDFPYPILCNIWGNHEASIVTGDYGHFSSDRGRESARYTRKTLTNESWAYIKGEMKQCGMQEFLLNGKRCLAVHGSLSDRYWGNMGIGEDISSYREFDYVFSGHSHRPHFIERYYPIEDAKMRNEKKVIFINPGSVGQPRNHNPAAQFAVLETETEQVIFEKVPYDIRKEQADYKGQVDMFYKERLEVGI